VTSASIRATPSRSREIVLVCRKCSKKVGGGFGVGGKDRLAKGLRRYLGVGKGKKARIAVFETGCFDICPKHRVTVTRGSRPDERLLIAPGTSFAEIVDRLNLAGIDQHPR
jgi:hypothetical protein